MASTNGLTNLPQHESHQRTEEETKSSNMTEAKTESQATKEFVDNDREDNVAGTAHTQVEPASSGTSTSPQSATDTSSVSHFKRRDEVKTQHYITKSHALVKDNLTAPLNADRDLPKFGEMVSELIHLLGAAGVGRNTTARAIAYMHGPDKLDPQQALAEARKDRDKKNGQRTASGGSETSTFKPQAPDKDLQKEPSSSDAVKHDTPVAGNGTGEDTKTSHAIAESDSNVKPADNTGTQKTTAHVLLHTETAPSKSTGTGRKRPFRNRKWFNRKGRGNNNDDKTKENQVQGTQVSTDDGQAAKKTLNGPSLDPAADRSSSTAPSTNGVAAAAA